MKYLISTITDYIVNNALSKDDEALFAINGFDSLEVYERLCQSITDKVKELSDDTTVTIKLADTKWNQFKKRYAGSPLIHVMKQNDWVAEGQSTTYYRNLHNSDILILMGTEDEDDAVGSLNEITTITPSNAVNLIPKADKKTQYHLLFGFTEGFNDNEIKALNNLYKDLFDLINPDIVKLSDFADKWQSDVTSFYDFAKLFFGSLPEWGLPLKEDSLPKISDINSAKNVLRQEFNFVNGTMFTPFSASLFNTNKRKLEKYDADQKKYCSKWDGWNKQALNSYSEYSKTLLGYISGDKNRSTVAKLLKTDFSITEDILGLKLDKSIRTVGKKIYGDPLSAFTKAVMDIMTECSDENVSLSKIVFNFHGASIIADDDDNENLLKQWRNICIHTNGVFDYIKNNAMFTYQGEEIDIVCTPEDYFEVTLAEKDYVTKARGNKATNKIYFQVICHDENDKIIARSPTKDSEWIFKSGEDWVTSFTDLCAQDFVKTKNPIIPLCTNNNIKSLVLAKSKDDFLQIMNEESDTLFNCDILAKNSNSSLFENNKVLYPHFYGLGTAFANFAYELSMIGLFNVLSNVSGAGVLWKLFDSYKRLGREILNYQVNQNEVFLITYFIHAFNIEENASTVLEDKDFDYCIVPPWHPASLEKISHMYRFFMDGCHEYWSQIDDTDRKSSKKVNEDKVDELLELSMFQNSVDLFPSNDSFFGATKNYGFYTVYSKRTVKSENTFRDLIDREAIYDDDFKARSYSVMNDDALMIFNVIENYIKAFPDAIDMLNLVFINPSDLQPIIAATHKYIQAFHDRFGEDRDLIINLKVLVRPENMGGKNYLTYWMNETFDVDSNVKIKTYLNVWRNETELDQYLNANNDIAFVMDLLKDGEYSFNNYNAYKPSKDECYFPIVFRPGPVASTSVNRVIEMSQPQFEAASIHTQVVHYKKSHEDPITDKSYYAVKNVNIDDEGRRIVNKLHEKAYWVVCIDDGLDGSLVKAKNDEKTNYSVIGFSTGKGKFGQYNLTITARNSIVNSIEKRFSSRLKEMFNWDDSLAKAATKICMDQAAYLDGISVLKASNKNDYNINEFMAYVLTALREKEINADSPLKTIVHLDSYKHWFSRKGESKSIFDHEVSKSRPDFLVLELAKDYEETVKIKATIVEVKIAKLNNKNEHLGKAVGQIKTGTERLREIFDPNSKSIKRRYWYAQLYRALAFAQITFEDKNPEYNKIAEKLRMILDGKFEIEWDSEILGYWVDLSGTDETCEIIEGVNVYNIPQIRIQRILLGDNDASVSYFKDIDFVDEIEEDVLNRNREKAIDEYAEKELKWVPKVTKSNKKKQESEEDKPDEMSSTLVPFTLDEGILLLSLLLKEKEFGWTRKETSVKASELLHSFAEKKGLKYDEPYRTPEGLVGRLKSLSASLYEEEASNVHKTKIFNEVVELYKNDNQIYENRLSEILSLLGIAEKTVSENDSPVISEIETPKDDNGAAEKTDSLKDIRVYIGKDNYQNKVYWEYGNPKLSNRHLLVTGTSGQGKTYCIQTLLYELSKTNISSIIFDYTEGFRKDQLEPKFLEKMKDNIHQEIVYNTGVPINPFKRHEINVSGEVIQEKTADVANRIANIFTHVYGFGEQQYAAIFTAARVGLNKYKDDMNMDLFRDELEKVKSTNPAAKSVISKMEPFFYSIEFVDDNDFDWGKILYTEKAKVNVFQLTQIDRAMQVIITELMLWDAWYYTQKNGSEDKPFVVVLDEAQNLSHKTNSPSAKILTEGRKFGWSAWFATQSLKILSDDEVVRLMQASFKIYFKPTDDEITKVSKQIDATDGNAWVGQIKGLTKGKCVVVGDRIRSDGTFGHVKPTVVSVESFDVR